MEKLGVPYPDTSAGERASAPVQFRFDTDSLLLAGLGVYGLHASTRLNGGLRSAGFVLAVCLLASGALGFFRRKLARIVALIPVLMVVGFGAYQLVALGFQLNRIIIVLCGLWACVYLICEYRKLE
jgi:hypothetical protein